MLMDFMNLGGVNSQLLEFKLIILHDTTVATQLTTTMMKFMVQGLFSFLMYSIPISESLCTTISTILTT